MYNASSKLLLSQQNFDTNCLCWTRNTSAEMNMLRIRCAPCASYLLFAICYWVWCNRVNPVDTSTRIPSQIQHRYNDINGTTSRKQGDKNKLWLLLNSSSGSSSGSSSAIRRSPYREQFRASPGFTRSPRYDTIKSAWFESSYSNASWRPDIIGSDLCTKHDT